MSEESDVREDEPVRTGLERVDAVIRDIESLDGRPVEEHVAAFERAHEELRRALDPSSGPRPVRPPVPQHLRPS